HSTNGLPFQWKPIGIARGNPSGPRYANRAGILDCMSSCASGSLSTRVTSCGCIVSSLRSQLRILSKDSPFDESTALRSARRVHVLVVVLERDVDERVPALDFLAERPRRRLHAQHDAVVVVVEFLAHVVGQLTPLLGVDFAQDRLDLVVVGPL